VLRGFGVAALYLFGSHARDEASPDSDVDVFVDVAPGAAFGLRPYMGAFRVLEDAFEHNAEIFNAGRTLAVHPCGGGAGCGANLLMAGGTSPRVRLLHMRDEIESLSQELRARASRPTGRATPLRRITERAIQIISEAARTLPEELRARNSDAPWADIIGIGNALRHEYHRIDDKVLREAATADLPKLQPIIRRILAEFES
jgi:uncharacterized protein with HEPN domain